MTRDENDQLRGVVALWLTNGNKPVDGGNDTRYDFFRGGWVDAAEATEELIRNGYLESSTGGRWAEDDFLMKGDLMVWPTAKGIFEVLR